MSYNISHWKTKKIENFIVPLKPFCRDLKKEYFLKNCIKEIDYNELGTLISIGNLPEEGVVEGYEKGDLLVINKLSVTGECSGSYKHTVLDEAFKKSKGIFEAVLIWEDGRIVRIKVKNGKVTEEEIEL